jgi:DNA binding domain, excisionase family
MQTLTSKEVSEMLGKRHDNLMRDIRKYINALGTDEAPNYFLEGAYKDGLGKERACYLVTKAGCELMAGRLIGERCTEFKEKYLEIFDTVQLDTMAEQVKEYTVQEAVELLGISERSVYRNIEKGKIKAVKRVIMIPSEKMMIPVEALEEYKRERGIV